MPGRGRKTKQLNAPVRSYITRYLVKSGGGTAVEEEEKLKTRTVKSGGREESGVTADTAKIIKSSQTPACDTAFLSSKTVLYTGINPMQSWDTEEIAKAKDISAQTEKCIRGGRPDQNESERLFREMELSAVALLMVVSVSLAQEDLEGKVFVFPKETNTAHVILRPTITEPLQKATICLRSYSDLRRPYSLFSMATRKYANAFHIYLQPLYTCIVYINNAGYAFSPNWKPYYGRHICVTWDSTNADVYLWLNGKRSSERRQYNNLLIDAESSIVLGQHQSSFGGGFDASQSLVGEISDVHMWDYVLTQEDIQKVLSGDLHGNVINWKSLRYEIKGEVLIKPEPQHLESKVFVFPKETDTDHVILRPTIIRPLPEVSVCLRYFTDLSRPYTLFSLATPEKDNAFVIYLQPPNTCSVYINQELTSFKTDSESLDWRHICVTWDSNTGVVQLWVNGKLYPRRVCMKGSSIAAETSIVLGQEQDSFGGKFDDKQSLVGEINDVHMWDYALTPEDIQKVISGQHNGNVINWISLYLEIKGEVLVQPKFQ